MRIPVVCWRPFLECEGCWEPFLGVPEERLLVQTEGVNLEFPFLVVATGETSYFRFHLLAF